MSQFPVLFSIGGSHRHEVIFVSSSTPVAELHEQIVQASSASPNATEFMSKYKKAGNEKVGSVKVRWSQQGRDQKIWPSTTTLTEENSEAVLRLMELGGLGRDVLEVTIEKVEEA